MRDARDISLGRRMVIFVAVEMVGGAAGGIVIHAVGDAVTIPVLSVVLGISVVMLISLLSPEIRAWWHRWRDPAAKALAAAERDRQEKLKNEQQESDALWEETVRAAQRHPGYRGVERDPETGTGRLLFAKPEDLIGLTLGHDTAVALEARKRWEDSPRGQRLWAVARWYWRRALRRFARYRRS